MKNLFLGILLISILLGCDKDDSKDQNNLEVDQYVELLKNGKYDSSELPEFTYEDILSLLEYRNETQLITNFPVNMISSLVISECSLGMYILWTIESIRAVAIDSEHLIGRFPSQNPIAKKREEPFEIEYENEVQEIISKSYNEWWENNKDKEFDAFKEIDPLANTAYCWH